MKRIASLCTTALVLLFATAGTAGAQQQIGTNLQRPADVYWDCTAGLGVFPGTPDCTYMSTLFGNESTAAPTRGVITRVRVKAAAPTGPMRVTVMRAIALGAPGGGLACCFFNGQSQRFTPRRNRITNVNVNLPVESSWWTDPPMQVVDYLGLTVLRAGYPIPGQISTNPGFEGSLAFFPHVQPRDRLNGRTDGGSAVVVPLLRATFVPLCGASPTRLPRASEELPAPATMQRARRCLGGAQLPARGGLKGSRRARIAVRCNLTERCRGRVVLLDAGTKLGQSRLRINSGKRKALTVPLNKKGRKRVRGKSRFKATAKVTVKNGPNARRKLKLVR